MISFSSPNPQTFSFDDVRFLRLLAINKTPSSGFRGTRCGQDEKVDFYLGETRETRFDSGSRLSRTPVRDFAAAAQPASLSRPPFQELHGGPSSASWQKQKQLFVCSLHVSTFTPADVRTRSGLRSAAFTRLQPGRRLKVTWKHTDPSSFSQHSISVTFRRLLFWKMKGRNVFSSLTFKGRHILTLRKLNIQFVNV